MRKRKTAARMTASALAVCMVAGSLFTGTAAGVQAADPSETDWEAVRSVVSRYYGEWDQIQDSQAISNTIPNTALLGNGDVGAASGGSDTEKKFYISKGDFCTYNGNPLPIGGITISEQEEDAEETAENLAPGYKEVTVSNYYVDATGKEFKPEDAVNGKMKQDANGYGWVTKRPQELEDGENPEYWLQPGGNERYPVL